MKPLSLVQFVLTHGLLAALTIIAVANTIVHASGSEGLYQNMAEVPTNSAGLLLGTSPYDLNGNVNPYFTGRIAAAAELYRRGKIQFVIASGDNEHRSYNEPQQMRAALEASGVPSDAIVLDFAGFRTLDSVVRADAVFQQPTFTIISQAFHNRRALYIAQHHGIEAVAYSASVAVSFSPWMVIREALARCLAVFDVAILGTEPRYYGDPEPVPTDG